VLPIEFLQVPLLGRALERTTVFWLLAILPALLVMVMIPLGGRSLIQYHALLTGWLCTAALIGAVTAGHSIALSSGLLATQNWSGSVFVMLIPAMVATAVVFLSFWAAFFLLRLPVITRRGRQTSRSLSAAWQVRSLGWEVATWTIGLLLGLPWIVANAFAYGVAIWGLTNTVFVASIVAALVVLGLFLGCRRCLLAGLAFLMSLVFLAAFLLGMFGVAYAIGFIIALGAGFVQPLFDASRAFWGWIPVVWNSVTSYLRWIVLGVFGAGVGFLALMVLVWVLMGVREWIGRLYWLLRFSLMELFGRLSFGDLPRSRGVWLQHFKDGNPYYQAYLLFAVSRHGLELHSDLEYLQLLEECETKVGREPAQGLYWRKRHELEESLKHERTGALSSSMQRADSVTA